MAVIVLMYHHTPEGAADGFFDVPLTRLREQIGALIDAGTPFIKFGECGNPEYVERGLHVAVTFDDGHASNTAAFGFLADVGVTPTAFVPRDWSQRDRRYLSAAALADLKGVCDLGAHGASHRALTTLSPAELDAELAASRDYLEAITGAPVASMALPGGHGAAREFDAASRAGFTLVGNSRALPHRRVGLSVNRVGVNRTHDARAPLRWLQTSPWGWAVARTRLDAGRAGRRLLGPRLYGAIAALAK